MAYTTHYHGYSILCDELEDLLALIYQLETIAGQAGELVELSARVREQAEAISTTPPIAPAKGKTRS
jgi:hypothetical protein